MCVSVCLCVFASLCLCGSMSVSVSLSPLWASPVPPNPPAMLLLRWAHFRVLEDTLPNFKGAARPWPHCTLNPFSPSSLDLPHCQVQNPPLPLSPRISWLCLVTSGQELILILIPTSILSSLLLPSDSWNSRFSSSDSSPSSFTLAIGYYPIIPPKIIVACFLALCTLA